MSKSLELPDETYEEIADRAAKLGLSPAELLVKAFPLSERPELSPPKSGESLYDRLKPFIGCVEGTSPDASKEAGKQFTDYLEEKRRQGRL